MKEERTTLWSLFWTFARIGVMTFGGGYAMLPMLEREVVNKHHWATEEEILDYFAIGQCTPGIIAVNTATFIGRKIKGVVGGIISTLGVVFPSFIIISVLAALISRYSDNPYVLSAFAGIRIAVCALITVSVFKLAQKAIKDLETTVIAVFALMSQVLLKVSPVLIVISIVVYGLVRTYFSSRKEA